jgi:hypothetical protein
MTKEKIKKMFITFLGRYPNEDDIKYYVSKSSNTLNEDILSCQERKDFISGPRIINSTNYPDSKPLDENEVKIAVGSHEKFYKKTLPIILPSLVKHGIKKTNIIVFIAGNEKSYQTYHSDIEFRFLDHNSFENSAFIDIIESDLSSPFWFFIHDTCKVGPRFKNSMLHVPEYVEKVALRSWQSMSIGLYSNKFIFKYKEKLISIKNLNYEEKNLIKRKLWGIPNEDLILWLAEPEKTYLYNNYNKIIKDHTNWFGEKTKRFTEYHSNLDLYKNKSDWHTYRGKNLIL